MKELGLAVFIVGVALAGLFAARPGTLPSERPKGVALVEPPSALERLDAWASAAGLSFLGALGLMIAGGVIARRAVRKPTAPAGAKGKSKKLDPRVAPVVQGSIVEALTAIGAEIEALPSGEPGAHVAELHEKLDHLLEESVPAFIERRLEVANELGLATYAEMIGHFAGMERNLGRAWSALTDEVYHEVTPSLERAKASLIAARETVEGAMEAGASSSASADEPSRPA